MGNAALICQKMNELGYTIYGGTNAPYVWVQTKNNMGSWEFFDKLLNNAHVVGTPGAGFGASGEGFLRLSAFAHPENVKTALDRISKL